MSSTWFGCTQLMSFNLVFVIFKSVLKLATYAEAFPETWDDFISKHDTLKWPIKKTCMLQDRETSLFPQR